MRNRVLKQTIHDAFPGGKRQLDLAVTAKLTSIVVEANFHGVCNMEDGVPIGKAHRPIVALEIWEGEFRVIVWSDINEEDPTHIIDLAGAKISNRKPDEKTFVIKLRQLIQDDDLDSDDEDYIGKLGLDGTRQVERRAETETAALDNFHSSFPIACLENYEITIQEN